MKCILITDSYISQNKFPLDKYLKGNLGYDLNKLLDEMIKIGRSPNHLLAEKLQEKIWILWRVVKNEVQNVLAMKLLNVEIKEEDEVTVDKTSPEGRVLDFNVEKNRIFNKQSYILHSLYSGNLSFRKKYM